MTTTEIAGTPVERDAEGFLVDPSQWTREVAEEIAQGIIGRTVIKHLEEEQGSKNDQTEEQSSILAEIGNQPGWIKINGTRTGISHC